MLHQFVQPAIWHQADWVHIGVLLRNRRIGIFAVIVEIVDEIFLPLVRLER